MKRSHRAGFGFGVTSGIITPLGIIVGLYSGTESLMVVVSGILTIAIADAFSDATGVHVSKESCRDYSTKEIWEATLSTFFSKFFFALLFVIPFILFTIKIAVIVSIIWGFGLLAFFSYLIAKSRNENPIIAIGEHLLISSIVIILTYHIPFWIKVFIDNVNNL